MVETSQPKGMRSWIETHVLPRCSNVGLMFFGGLLVGVSTNMLVDLMSYRGCWQGMVASLFSSVLLLACAALVSSAAWRLSVHHETELFRGGKKGTSAYPALLAIELAAGAVCLLVGVVIAAFAGWTRIEIY